MWPYSSRKNGRSLELFGNNPYLIAPKSTDLNREYFQQINQSAHSFNHFTSYQLEQDGRVVQTQGHDPRDVTNDVCSWDTSERKKHGDRGQQSSKQLHIRNVTQLKVALDMPDNQRRVSLSHITGAIIRNEVAPTLNQLRDPDFVRANLPADRLPPLRRKSIEIARRMETLTSNRNKRRPSINRHQLARVEAPLYLPILTTAGSKENSKPQQAFGRKRSNGHLYSYGANLINQSNFNDQNDAEIMYETSMASGLRSDSIGKLTNEISDQFKQIIMMSKVRAEKTDKSQAMHISGKVTSAGETSTLPTDKSVLASYKRRHEYGKNLEKNWFKSFIQKTKKKPKSKPNNVDNTYDMRLDIFYSPEPEPDEEYEEFDDDNADDFSMQCGGYSSATTEKRCKQIVRMKNLGEQDEEYEMNTDDDLSSGSDIEIILKDDQLIQRRTKHKLKKKRKRQLERYRAFMPTQMETVKEGHEAETEVTLTDQEIRAIRLNLRNKERMKKLKGKRKFLQAANAVYIAVQFKNILQKIRKRKLREIRRRQIKIASMIAKRVQWKDRQNNQDEASESNPTPQPTLKDVFLNSVGEKLIHDVANLRLLNDVEEEDEEDEEECTTNNQEDKIAQKRSSVQKPRKVSKLERELKRVSMKDIEIAFPSYTRPETWRRKRRNSIPVQMKPSEFIVEINEKIRRKNKHKQHEFKPVRRPQSPPIRKCACLRHKAEEASRLAHDASCHLQNESQKKPKTKLISVPTSGLSRTYSLPDLAKLPPIELRDLLHDIDIPAKEIKLQILARKFRRQRKKKQQIRLDPYITPTSVNEAQNDEGSSDSDTGSCDTDSSDSSDYDFIYGGPFVGSGVMWNQNARDVKQVTWTTEDVERELKKITRIFHDMKECRYLRLGGFNEAVLGRLRENSF